MHARGPDGPSRQLFGALKPICVPLFKASKLTPESINVVSNHMRDVLRILQSPTGLAATPLDQGMIEYIFIPVSGIMKRNTPAEIPDHVLEPLLRVLAVLVRSWWWTLEPRMWMTLVAFCSVALPAGDPTSKGKAKERDEETQLAAVECLHELLRDHSLDEVMGHVHDAGDAMKQIQAFTTSSIPLLAQVLTSLLAMSASRHQALQTLSLTTLQILVELYFGERHVPNILPGVISKLTRLSVRREGRAHQLGNVVQLSLGVMQRTICLGIGDKVCIREGVVRAYDSLDDFASSAGPSPSISEPEANGQPGAAIQRTTAWLNATTAQLHNALNSLIPQLIDHPTPSASLALIVFCREILESTTLTLPQSQKLLIVPLLILSLHTLPEVSSSAKQGLLSVLRKGSSSPSLTGAFTELGNDNLSALPQLLIAGLDDRTHRSLQILIAIGALSQEGVAAVSQTVAHVLGPTGGIEKWGWSMLDTLSFSIPSVYYAPARVESLLIESPGEDTLQFPEVTIDKIENLDTQRALAAFFTTWGRAGGDDALFSVEWFLGYAAKGAGTSEVAALWCAARLLEGIANSKLSETTAIQSIQNRSARLKQHARWSAKLVSSFWDRDLEASTDENRETPHLDKEDRIIEVKKGIESLDKLLDIGKNAKANNTEALQESQRILYRVQALQILALDSTILESRFPPLLIQAIYPILYSFVSPHPFLSATADTTLLYVARACGYASASNMLLSNFDYALGSVSRYLTRQRLDLHAPRVLVILVRLVGKGVVDRASDVVEECFDRLDDYHGYRVVVEGLVEVLLEVVRAIELEDSGAVQSTEEPHGDIKEERRRKPENDVAEFVKWYKSRRTKHEEEKEDFGPHPRRAWGENKDETNEEAEQQSRPPEDAEPKLSSTQKLVQQILKKSVYFLTHPSAIIRAKVLSVLASSISTLSSIESSLLPTIHVAWPFILNRFKNKAEEPFVAVEAAELIRALVEHVGHFMDSKIWEDVWPVFKELVKRLETADQHSALTRRSGRNPVVGTESAYSTSHRLYRAILATISVAIKEVALNDHVVWEVLITCRRFMSEDVHAELQELARTMYLQMARKNADAVWLVLGGAGGSGPGYLLLEKGKSNTRLVFQGMDLISEDSGE